MCKTKREVLRAIEAGYDDIKVCCEVQLDTEAMVEISRALALASTKPPSKPPMMFFLDRNATTQSGLIFFLRALPTFAVHYLCIASAALTDSALATLARSLASPRTKLEGLCLSGLFHITGLKLTSAGLETFFAKLRHSKLDLLLLDNCRLNNACMEALALWLPHADFVGIHLNDCTVDFAGIVSLTQVLPRCQIVILDLERVSLGDTDMKTIMPAVASSIINRLSLRGNLLTDAAVPTIVRYIMRSKNLSKIATYGNRMTEAGETAIKNACTVIENARHTSRVASWMLCASCHNLVLRKFFARDGDHAIFVGLVGYLV